MVAVVIPALEPPPTLSALCARLAADPCVTTVLVIDDGSGQASQGTFYDVARQPRTQVLRQAPNQGKGAALKLGLRQVLDHLPGITTIVTADADGQHLPDDILRVAASAQSSPGSLVLGVRQIDTAAPARSRFGNGVTRSLYRGLVGQRLTDTQTGLRAFSRELIGPLLEVPGNAYEYELNVLISCRQARVPVVQEPITTVYLDGNRASHFRLVRDSWRVYSVLLGFASVSLLSAVVDNLLFLSGLMTGVGPVMAFLGARVISMAVNYQLVRRLVFAQPSGYAQATVRRYVMLVGSNMVIGQALMFLLRLLVEVSLPAAKIIVETLLFLPNFLLQRDVVFRPSPLVGAATDWTSYYSSVPFTAALTRRYTTRILLKILGVGVRRAGPVRTVTELGGANSCFVDRVCAELKPQVYTVVDRNQYGLSLLDGWRPPAPATSRLIARHADVRDLEVGEPSDAVFSVGLVEHFEPAVTRAVLRTHFAMTKPGGIVVVSYPTPTVLYRMARRALEFFGLWTFPDERPLRFAEVAPAVADLGDVIARRMLWPLLLTQEMVTFRKR